MSGQREAQPSPQSATQPSLGDIDRAVAAISRRRFLVGAAGSAIGATILAACGGGKSDATKSDTKSATATGDASANVTPSEASTVSGAAGESSSAASSAAGSASAAASDVGTVTIGGAPSGTGIAAMQAAIDATGIDVKVNNVDRNSWVENFNTYLQQPDDVIQWYAGYRMRAFAAKGVIGDISDVWKNMSGFTDGFKSASTGLDGKQYLVPFTFYPWGVFYRQSIFKDKGYEVPKTWDDFKALCKKMQDDGMIPIASCNDGGWPQMGWFDMINMRTNGYDFHISLMGGKEKWDDPKVKQVFTTWNEVVPFYQPDFAARKWEEAATALGNGEAGMFLLGSFMAGNFDPEADPKNQEILDDLTFFKFPEINAEHGQDAIEAPIDGFLMAAKPQNEEGAKALLTQLGSPEIQDVYIANDNGVLPANSKANTSSLTPLQQHSLKMVNEAKYISQFLDRDTDPDFASQVIAPALQDFLAGQEIDGILANVEQQKATYTFE